MLIIVLKKGNAVSCVVMGKREVKKEKKVEENYRSDDSEYEKIKNEAKKENGMAVCSRVNRGWSIKSPTKKK